MADAAPVRKAGWKQLFFEEIPFGKVGRSTFAKALIVLGLLLLTTGVTLLALFDFAEDFSIDSAVGGMALIMQLTSFTVAGLYVVVFGVFAFAFANLIAKRMRDLGLPGWKALAIATMLGTAFSLGTPFLSAAIYVAVVWAVLLAMPSPRRR